MSRRDNSPSLTVISWRDIPAQVTAKSGDEKATVELPHRFSVAIDRAAMYAGLFGTDDYLNEWRRETRPCGDDLNGEVAAEVSRIEKAFTSDILTTRANNGGFIPNTPTNLTDLTKDTQ